MVEKPSLILKRTVRKQESLPASGHWFPGTIMRDGEVTLSEAEACRGKSLPRTDRMRGWQEECVDKQGKKDEVQEVVAEITDHVTQLPPISPAISSTSLRARRRLRQVSWATPIPLCIHKITTSLCFSRMAQSHSAYHHQGSLLQHVFPVCHRFATAKPPCRV